MRETAEPVRLFVVHWNQPRACGATVRALLDQNVPLAVTIVDNCSAPDAYAELQREIDSKIVRLPENKGWGPALNVVLRDWLSSTRGRYCLISAHDAAPSPRCLELLVQAMERDPRIGIACPQYADGSVPRFSALHGVQVHVDLPRDAGVAQFVDVPHGTLMLLRRECLAEIGLFDERYFAYGDEHELGARAVRRGWKVAMVWGAVVTNPATSTPSAWRSYLFARNSLLLVHDYFGRTRACLRAVLIIINSFRLLVCARDKSFEARSTAVRDYFAGRFGPPAFE